MLFRSVYLMNAFIYMNASDLQDPSTMYLYLDEEGKLQFTPDNKEDESGKKIIKIKDLAYNLEAVAEVMGNEIFIKTALSKYTYRIYEVKGECWCEYVGALSLIHI